jgi:tRNA A-37 threonylcarbamoyl transferase component Bud32/DNA-binding NarL/FixJ family response regulator
MHLMLIDDSEESRLRVMRMLKDALPAAEVEQWNPSILGWPDRDFDWKRIDALLLSDCPAQNDGLAWLSETRKQSRMPPSLILAEGAGDDMAVKALKAGAIDCLDKTGISPERLTQAIREALLTPPPPGSFSDLIARTQPLDPSTIGSPAQPTEVHIKGYRILRKIGEGGMAKVYLAERRADDYQVVLKVLNPLLAQDSHFVQRFEREYRVISKIQNEHVVTIFDHGISERYAFLAMEYFSGGDLKQRMRQGISSMSALKILVQIAKALDAVHSAGVIHRDLKPQNIMFRDNSRLALVDFGLAKEIDVDSSLTAYGMILATPLYMSPEQCQGIAPDARGDLYSVGILLYEMLTGKHPYTADSAPALAYQHVHADLPRLPGKLSGYQNILDRLLSKKPEDRFQSARELFAYIAH